MGINQTEREDEYYVLETGHAGDGIGNIHYMKWRQR